MAAIKSMNRVLGTRLVQIFGGRLKDWADELQKCSGTIVAISRKGPRLIELMAREGFLSEIVLSRVVAEQALPFLTQNDNAGFVVIDDAMTFGTTFDNIYRLTKQADIRCGGDGSKLTGIPFAVGKKATDKHRKLVMKYFLDLEPNQIAPLVNNEMLAFRLLGKPYDIEHPMLTWTGDFTDTIELEAALTQITEMLGGQIFDIDTPVPTSQGIVPVRRWTILLPADSRYNFYPHADFRKLRIYLNPEKDRLLVVAMCPLSLSKADMDSLEEILPAPLNHLWSDAVGKIDSEIKADSPMAIAGSYSLAMWANFLFAVIFLRDIKAAFIEAFQTAMPPPQMFGPRHEDLRYLIGPALCFRAESSLANFLDCVDSTSAAYPIFDHTAEIIEENVPLLYEENYKNKRSSLIDKALEVNDVLQAIFYAQHTDIELISREDNIEDDDKRLKFGITYSKLRRIVQTRFPDVPEIDIHECLDRLIDNGAVVPRYLDMALPGKPAIWVRTFRIGEGTVKEIAHTVRLLFEKLSATLGVTELPAVVFEKFCVLALCIAKDVPALQPLDSLKIFKLFHLYGARPALMQGKKQEFLTEWAVEQNILSRGKSTAFTEVNGNYSLGQDIEKLYPQRECHWDNNVKDGLEDLAALVAAIHAKYKGSALVALTSVASKQDLQRALEAELHLWLHDHTASVHKGLAALNHLAENMAISTPTQEQLESVNSVLSKMANFTAQVNVKIKLEEGLKNTYNKIDDLVATDKFTNRCWRDLRVTLDERIRIESAFPGLREITSTLRIAHVTTRILRELLTLAGFKSEQSRGLEESLNQLQVLFEDPEKVDHVTRRMFEASDMKPDITTLITVAKDQSLDDFDQAFSEVRKLVSEIADRCERVFQVHGIDSHNEQSHLLEPPRYIMMWDIKGSTNEENRDKIESLIVDANRRIGKTLGKQVLDFHAESKDDGNGFICKRFTDALTAFQILNEVFCDYSFRAGCEVNLQGQLNYYPESKSLGGRAYDHAARVMTFFKEIKTDPARWSGNSTLEPTESYMVVGEFAKRYAQEEKIWPENETYIITELAGIYKARVDASLPVSLTILQPLAFKPKGLEKTETHKKQQELI